MNSLDGVMVIGLTGQTGAGKSTVSPVLQLSLPLLQFLSFSLQVVLLSWLLLSYYPVCVLFF